MLLKQESITAVLKLEAKQNILNYSLLGLFPMSKNVQENCVNLCADTPQAT
jgi:hypothetical protein